MLGDQGTSTVLCGEFRELESKKGGCGKGWEHSKNFAFVVRHKRALSKDPLS